MRLRKIREEDLETVRKLRNDSRRWFIYSSFITKKQHKKWFDFISTEKTIQFYVIIDKNEVIGTISLTIVGNEIEIGNLIIEKNSRRKGVMKKVLNKVMKKGQKYFSRVLFDNENSKKLFESCGFRPEILIYKFQQGQT